MINTFGNLVLSGYLLIYLFINSASKFSNNSYVNKIIIKANIGNEKKSNKNDTKTLEESCMANISLV